MSRSPRPPKPIESYGAELLQALIEGTRRTITFTLPYNKAVGFRQRAHSLRATMRQQKHELASSVAKTKITITWPPETVMVASSRNVQVPKDIRTPCTVTIAPADSEFVDVLKGAGVEVKPLDETSLPEDPKPEPTAPHDDILGDYLAKE